MLLLLLLMPSAGAQARLTPVSATEYEALKQALTSKLLPPRAQLVALDREQAFALRFGGVPPHSRTDIQGELTVPSVRTCLAAGRKGSVR